MAKVGISIEEMVDLIKIGFNAIYVLVHNGKMHWDDVLAAVFIKKTAEHYNSNVAVKIVRDRNVEKFLNIYPNGIVTDLGGGQYDHHGMEAVEFYPNGIQYSALGKILRDVPEEVVSKELKEEFLSDCGYYIQASDNGKEANISNSDKYRLLVKLGANEELLQNFCKEASFNPDRDMIKEGHYRDYLGDAIDSFNCTEGEGGIYCKQQDVNFLEAVKTAEFLVDELLLKEQEKLDGVKAVKKVIEEQHGPVLTLPRFISGWQETVIAENDERKDDDKVKFVIFPSGKEYRVSTVPIENGSKFFVKGLKESLRGKEKEVINNDLGIEDAVFVHNSGFIGGTVSYESALKMAKASL